MAVYAIDKTSNATVIAGIKAALNAAGILETTYYETNSLIVKTARSNKVLRIVPNLGRVSTYIGDSWSAGDAVVNQVAIATISYGTSDQINVIITDKILCIGCRTTDPYLVNAVFAQLDSTAQEYVAIGIAASTSSYMVSALRDLTNNVVFDAWQLNATIVSTDGYYYASDFQCCKNDATLLATAIQGLKPLQMPSFSTSQYIRYGDDVVIPGGAVNGVVYFPKAILIPNGYSWTP